MASESLWTDQLFSPAAIASCPTVTQDFCLTFYYYTLTFYSYFMTSFTDVNEIYPVVIWQRLTYFRKWVREEDLRSLTLAMLKIQDRFCTWLITTNSYEKTPSSQGEAATYSYGFRTAESFSAFMHHLWTPTMQYRRSGRNYPGSAVLQRLQ